MKILPGPYPPAEYETPRGSDCSEFETPKNLILRSQRPDKIKSQGVSTPSESDRRGLTPHGTRFLWVWNQAENQFFPSQEDSGSAESYPPGQGLSVWHPQDLDPEQLSNLTFFAISKADITNIWEHIKGPYGVDVWKYRGRKFRVAVS